MKIPPHHSDNATRETMTSTHWRAHVMERTCTLFSGQQVPVDDDRRFIPVGEWLAETQSARLSLHYTSGETVHGSVEMMAHFVDGAIRAGHDESLATSVAACRRKLNTNPEESMADTNEPRFIIWDPKEGEPRRSADGGYVSAGCMGVMTLGNIYLTAYGSFSGRKPADLAVHERCPVTYSLSGTRGEYQVIRIA